LAKGANAIEVVGGVFEEGTREGRGFQGELGMEGVGARKRGVGGGGGGGG